MKQELYKKWIMNREKKHQTQKEIASYNLMNKLQVKIECFLFDKRFNFLIKVKF